jgi:hypothetical protein
MSLSVGDLVVLFIRRLIGVGMLIKERSVELLSV